MTLSPSSILADVAGEPEEPDPNFPDAPDDEPDSRDDERLDFQIDRLAEDAPLDREMTIEIEAALTYLHERLDDDARVVLGRALDLVADRHHQVVRFVARKAVRHARAGAGGSP